MSYVAIVAVITFVVGFATGCFLIICIIFVSIFIMIKSSSFVMAHLGVASGKISWKCDDGDDIDDDGGTGETAAAQI